jgi:hypothetical protein
MCLRRDQEIKPVRPPGAAYALQATPAHSTVGVAASASKHFCSYTIILRQEKTLRDHGDELLSNKAGRNGNTGSFSPPFPSIDVASLANSSSSGIVRCLL